MAVAWIAPPVEHRARVTARTAPAPAASELRVRVATPDDASALAEFAARTFTATYARGGHGSDAAGSVATSAPEDVAAYVAAAFTPERMRVELDDPAQVTFIAVTAGAPTARSPTAEPPTAEPPTDRWAGYAQLRLHPLSGASVPPPCAGPHPRELARLYVERAWQGRGVADRLMDAAVARAAGAPGGADPLWLAVYEANARAVAFYRRRGFAIVGATTFTMGNEVQQDWLMVWRG